MRVVLSTYGSRGDVEPLVGLAVRLRDLGADVRLCAPPDEEFAARSAALGVPLVPVGDPVRALVTGAAQAPTDFPTRVARLTAASYEAVLGQTAEGGAVVATGLFPSAAGARAAAEKAGARFVYAGLQPTALPSPHHPPFRYPGRPAPPEGAGNAELWELDVESMNALFGGAVNAHRASVGLPTVANVRDHVLTERPWLATDPTLGPWRLPAGLDVVQTGAWLLPDPRPLPAGLTAFLDAGQPPVYVGFGSMPMRGSEDVARLAVEQAGAAGHRVVVGRGWADLSGGAEPPGGKGGGAAGPGDCFVVGEVNHQALFARVAAVVHHGGAGTTAAAARAGAPQLVVPQIVDQPYWAARVAELGIGAVHDTAVPTAGSVAAALRVVLSPQTRDRAAAVAAGIRTDGAEVAARLLLDRS
ncbi:glycosyltransferase [Kitasatospora purpeofusca]|uniref:glycosyltransferase n=1 Tax=Kitasatospora purpeofusca TaxID=67352 RepID=UPI002A5A5C39|nr:glycosyltransferase [Kitasatospora purpeofusca]MDY0812217.1 glycosyltransferase [Kitasatospora purpeofusca]